LDSHNKLIQAIECQQYEGKRAYPNEDCILKECHYEEFQVNDGWVKCHANKSAATRKKRGWLPA